MAKNFYFQNDLTNHFRFIFL